MANDLMGLLMPSEDDALKRALMAAGFGMLGTPKGQELSGIGRAGLLGMGTYENSLQNQLQNNAGKLALAQHAMKMQADQQAAQQQQEAMGALARMPTSPSSIAPGPPAQFQQPGWASALMAGAAGASMPPPEQLATQLAAPPEDPAAQKMAQANYLEEMFRKSGGTNVTMFTMAQKLREEALKMRDENQGFETVMGPNGQPQIVQRRKFGAPQVMPFQPKPDMKFQDLGGSVQAIDALRTQPGQSFAKTMDPGQTASNQVALAHLALARNADARAAAAAAGGGKPQWDATAGMFVYPPSADSPTGRVAQPEGYNKIQKPLTESQSKNALYLGMMKTATEGIDKISGLSTAEISLARGDMAYVPQFMQNIASGEKAQQYVQGSLQWTEAMLRITTGATAPPEELKRVSKTFFPQVGDGPEVIAQKAARRAQMEQFVAIGAGKGASQVEDALANKGTSESDYARLPSGATYTAPDGTTRRKR